jgi:hypothetical protein
MGVGAKIPRQLCWCKRESACASFQNYITKTTNQENVDVRSSRITTSSKEEQCMNFPNLLFHLLTVFVIEL